MGKLGRKFHERILLGGDFSGNLLIISILIVILLPVYNAAFVSPSLTEFFNETMTNDATRIARHFMALFEDQVGGLTKESFAPDILEEANMLKEDFGLAKLKIYSTSGEVLFSTDPEEIGKINKEPYFQEIIAKGGVDAKVVRKNSETLEHEKMPVDVVEAYVPLMKNGNFLGAFEVYYDISEKKQNLERLLLISFIIVMALAGFVLAISAMNVVKERRRLRERRRAEEEREKLIGELQEALAEVRTLSGLLPICSSCKKIRDDQGYWNQIEVYISHHTQATFSHGLCPDCAKKLYPDYFQDEKIPG